MILVLFQILPISLVLNHLLLFLGSGFLFWVVEEETCLFLGLVVDCLNVLISSCFWLRFLVLRLRGLQVVEKLLLVFSWFLHALHETN
jgi:hypothetical protein